MSERLIFQEIFTIKDLKRREKRKNEVLSYYYRHFSYFQNERSKVIDDLKAALNENCKAYDFSDWCRVINFEFSDQPLSAKGSLLDPIGGRFNIGDLEKYKFPSFPALYIAEDDETAYREKFQMDRSAEINGLSSDELALNRGRSTSHIAIDGSVSTVFDLTKIKSLQNFYNVVSKIKLPKPLVKEAKHLKLPVWYSVKSLNELYETILDTQWRWAPMQLDIPSNSQIFGQIANLSGIEGVLYPTKMKTKKKCLALFVENFENSPSFVRIKDSAPRNVITSLDSETYRGLM